jgi:hypothetical protein
MNQYELQRKGDLECYDKVMESHPNYPKIWWYNLVLVYKQKAKEYFNINGVTKRKRRKER